MVKLQTSVQNYLHYLMKKNPTKFYIMLKIAMVNNSKEGVKQRATVGFNGELRTLLRTSEIPHMYEVSRQKILQSFDRWLKNGSGWVLESVEGLTLHTAEYVSPSGSSYIHKHLSLLHTRNLL
jgi:hypothetical protein